MDTLTLEINIEDILAILGDSKRPIIEGEAVLLADHILLCGFKFRDDKNINLLAYVVQSSKIHGEPHEVNIKLSITKNAKIILCKCSCPAGLGGKCKHIFATLLHVNRIRMQNVQQVSCTDVRQKWGRVKRNIQHPYNNSALPIQNYCHFSKEDAIVDYSSVDEALNKSFLHKLLSCEPDGEAAIHFSKRRRTDYIINTTPYNPDYLLHLSLVHSLLDKSEEHLRSVKVDVDCQSEYYQKNVKITYTEAVKLFMDTLGQSNIIWHNARKCRITGSICYELYTYSFNANPDWMKKCQSVFYSNFKGNTSTIHGILHEDKAILLYEQNLDVKVEKTGFLVNPTCPWLGFSADGVQWDSKLLIEIKCPERGKTVSASQLIEQLSFIKNVNGQYVLNENHKYYAQVQLGMMLLGLPRCHFVVYCSFDESMVIFEVEYSPTFTCNMFNVLKKIYFYYVLPCLEFYGENES